MMNTTKLLAELERSDAIRRKATIAAVGFGENPHDIVVQCYGSDRNDNLDAVRQATIDAVRYAQQLRAALARIAELEAVVVPLEKILKLGYVACIDIDSDDYCVECYRIGIQSADYRGKTLAEALAAANKAMGDAT